MSRLSRPATMTERHSISARHAFIGEYLNQSSPRGVRRQRGTVLVVSLVILLAMTLIGITALQKSIMEERMAGNLKDRNVAFQGGEAGLRVALDWLDGLLTPPVAKSDGGNKVWTECSAGTTVHVATGCPANTAPDVAWAETAGNYVAYTNSDFADNDSALSGVAAQPKIVIEERYSPPLDFQKQAKGAGVHHYTVSALAYGGRADTRSLLQTTVVKVFAW